MSETFGAYDFGLDAAGEARARRLHHDSVIVDMVHQGAGGWRLFERPEFAALRKRLSVKYDEPLAFMADALEASYADPDLLRDGWEASGVTGGYLFVDVPRADAPGAARLGRVGAELLRRIPWLTLALDARDIRDAKAAGRRALVGYCQPVYGLPPDLVALDQAFENGLRVLMLTYNAADEVGAGCTAAHDAGLSLHGRAIVDWCERRGVLVDTSHCGRRTTLDACHLATRPVLANHTAASAVHPHPRGKDDETLRAIAATGGIIGVVTVPFFLSARPDASIEATLDHLDHIAGLVGPEHVGIGSDWPLTGPKEGIGINFGAKGLARIGFDARRHGIDAERSLVGFDDYRDFPNITRGLVARGWSDADIRGVLGENFLRVFGRRAG